MCGIHKEKCTGLNARHPTVKRSGGPVILWVLFLWVTGKGHCKSIPSYQLYSTTVDMIRNMSFANILKKDIIRKTAEESLEKIDQSLNMIAEKGEYDNYDFTEVFMYLLNAHSLYNIFEQSSIVLLSWSLGCRYYSQLGKGSLLLHYRQVTS